MKINNSNNNVFVPKQEGDPNNEEPISSESKLENERSINKTVTEIGFEIKEKLTTPIASRKVYEYPDVNCYLKINGGPSFGSCSNAAICSAYIENEVPITEEEMHSVAQGNFRSEASLRKELSKYFKVSRLLFDDSKATAENIKAIEDDDGIIIRYTHDKINHAEFIDSNRAIVSNALEWGDKNNRKSYIATTFNKYCWYMMKGYKLPDSDEWVRFDRLYEGVGIDIFKLKLKPNVKNT